MSMKPFTTFAALLVLSSTPALAQDASADTTLPGDTPSAPATLPAPMNIVTMDSNQDGVISENEFNAGAPVDNPSDMFTTLDSDHSGNLDGDEIKMYNDHQDSHIVVKDGEIGTAPDDVPASVEAETPIEQ